MTKISTFRDKLYKAMNSTRPLTGERMFELLTEADTLLKQAEDDINEYKAEAYDQNS